MFGIISDKLYSLKQSMNKFTTFFFLVFSLIGIAALIYSFVLRAQDKEFFENAESVTATICNIEQHETKDSDGNIKYEHYVYVDYEVNGESFTNVYLCQYQSGMHEGDTIEAFYNPNNPSAVKAYFDVDSYYNNIVGVAIFFMVVGALPVIISLISGRGKYKNRGLIETGRSVCATIRSIEANYNTQVNGKHPYWVICEEVNEIEGVIYRYTSHKVYEDLTRRIAPGDQVAVYINPNNPDQYYVNLDEIM